MPTPAPPYESLTPTARLGRVLFAFVVIAMGTLPLPVLLTDETPIYATSYFFIWLAAPLAWLPIFGLDTAVIALTSLWFGLVSVALILASLFRPHFFPYPFAVIGCALWLATGAVPLLFFLLAPLLVGIG